MSIILAIVYLCTLAFLYFHNQEIAKERKQLYDRIQSNNLGEYKALAEPVKREEPAEPKEKPNFV